MVAAELELRSPRVRGEAGSGEWNPDSVDLGHLCFFVGMGLGNEGGAGLCGLPGECFFFAGVSTGIIDLAGGCCFFIGVASFRSLASARRSSCSSSRASPPPRCFLRLPPSFSSGFFFAAGKSDGKVGQHIGGDAILPVTPESPCASLA
ncbi:hypothetical protein ACP70R_014537 [Stipagrostis hirtigluma subsp. patula]